MHLSGKYFNYNNQSSAIWGLFFAQVELTPDRRRMGGPAYSTQYNRLSHHHFLQQDTWEEPLSFDVEIVSGPRAVRRGGGRGLRLAFS